MLTPQEKIIEFNQTHTYMDRDCLFVQKLKEKDFTDEQIAFVLETMEDVCTECFDREGMCYCSNDD